MQPSHAINPASPARGAFTLVELMVSVAVLAVLVMMLTSTFNAASRAWLSGEGNAERQRSARALTDFIANELQGALIPVEGLASTEKEGNLQFLINPSNDQLDEFQNADSIFWQAPLATETSFGDVAIVGYFVRWNEEDGKEGTPVPQLCRLFINPSRVVNGVLEANPAFNIYTTYGNNKWLKKGVLDAQAPATKKENYRGLFAENVVGLWVRAYERDGDELLTGENREYDSRIGYNNNIKVEGRSWTEKRYLPARVQVSLAQIDSTHAPRLQPVWEKVRELTKDEGVRDASQFLEKLRNSADATPGLRPLLPGIRIYSTDVYLDNGR